MPKVSVVIPSYNHDKYISAAIQSVLDQRFQDFEIIITDDCSTDNTVNIIKTFNDPRIKLFTLKKNKGSYYALNHCLLHAEGEYIAQLNSDDVFSPLKLEKQVEFLDAHPQIAAVFTNAEIIDEQGNVHPDHDHYYATIFAQENRTRQQWLRRFFFESNCLCHPSVLIRKSVHDDLGPYDMRYFQLADLDYWIRLCKKYEIHILPEKLFHFRLRDGELNGSGNRPEACMRSAWEERQILKHYFTMTNIEDLLLVFPELKKYMTGPISDPIGFYLIKYVLEHPITHHHAFTAIQCLYEFLERDSKDIFHHSFLSCRDLINLTGNVDLFNDGFGRIPSGRPMNDADLKATIINLSLPCIIRLKLTNLILVCKKFFMKPIEE